MIKNINYVVKNIYGVVVKGETHTFLDDEAIRFMGISKVILLDILSEAGFFKAYHLRKIKKINDQLYRIILVSKGKQEIENVYQIEIA